LSDDGKYGLAWEGESGLVSYKIRGFVAEKVLQLHFSNRLAFPSLLVGAWVHLFAAIVQRPKSPFAPVAGTLSEKSSVSSNKISLVIVSCHGIEQL
jgi:hypothetical protein